MSKGLFITATGTDVGKTYVTALIVKKLREAGLKAGYYKAALSGAEKIGDKLVPGDAEYVNRTAVIGARLENMVSYVYQNAVSPHLAAQIEGNPVELAKVLTDYAKVKNCYEYVTVEGSGGIVCPIRYDEQQQLFLTDIIKAMNLSTLIIADAGLGTINNVVLTVEYIKRLQIEVKGIILNHYIGDVMQDDNVKMIEAITNIPVIAHIKANDSDLDIDVEVLAGLYEEDVIK